MDILKPILDIYDVKKDVLLFYLEPKVKQVVEDLDYLDDDNQLFLNDKVFLINRSTLELEHNGLIQAIKENLVTIKVKSTYAVHFQTEEYHVFIKRRKTKKNDREFYKALLEAL